MIISGTGHRPSKLVFEGVKNYSEEQFKFLTKLAEHSFIKLQPTKVISGMALGWDMAVAQAAINQSIPFVAAVPFKGQEKQWPQSSQNQFNSLLSRASETVLVSEGSYEPWKMQIRNQYLVDHCDLLVALWDGSKGGTGNCIEYAKKLNKPIRNLWEIMKPFHAYYSQHEYYSILLERYTDLAKILHPESTEKQISLKSDLDNLKNSILLEKIAIKSFWSNKP